MDGSVMALYLAAPALLPGDCLLAGVCRVAPAAAGPAPGLMFLAVGLVLGGASAWYRSSRPQGFRRLFRS